MAEILSKMKRTSLSSPEMWEILRPRLLLLLLLFFF